MKAGEQEGEGEGVDHGRSRNNSRIQAASESAGICAVIHCLLRLGYFDCGRIAAVWEPDHRASFHVTTFQLLDRQLDMAGLDAHAGNVILASQRAPGDNIHLGQLRAEERVIDRLGQLFVGDGLTGKHTGHKNLL